MNTNTGHAERGNEMTNERIQELTQAFRADEERQRELFEDLLYKLEEAAEIAKIIGREDEGFRRTVVAELEGDEGGWMGEQLIDVVRKRLAALNESEPESCN